MTVCPYVRERQPATHRFGPGVSVTFRLFQVTTFINRSHTFTRPASLASCPPWYWQSPCCDLTTETRPKWGITLSGRFTPGRCQPRAVPRLLDTAIQVN